MVLAALGASVVCTDLEVALPLLQYNVDCNFGGSAAAGGARVALRPGVKRVKPTVAALKWGDFDADSVAPFDVLVASDVAYDTECFEVLTETLATLLPRSGAGSDRVAYLGYERRIEDEDTFFAGLKVECCTLHPSVPAARSCSGVEQARHFHVTFVDIPEYDVGLTQPESHCIFKLTRMPDGDAT